VATSSKAFASDIAVKSRDSIKLHQERHDANSVISHIVVASNQLSPGCFLKTRVIVFEKFTFDGFFVLKKHDYL